MRLIEKAYAFAKEATKLDWEEKPGKGSNQNILAVYKAVDGLDNPEIDDSQVPWCSCFVNYCVQNAGGKGTRSAAARSWLEWGNASSGVEGDIVVLRRGNSSWQGHVGFVVKKNALYVWILGGNQSNNLNVSKYLRAKVLGYRTSKD